MKDSILLVGFAQSKETLCQQLVMNRVWKLQCKK